MKYVIKNCDNYTEIDKDWSCRSTIQNRKGCYCCQDCTDCLIKQVIDMCRDEMRFDRKSEFALATDINSFFDIEEVINTSPPNDVEK